MIYLDYAATNPFTKYPCSKYGTFINPNANYAYKEKKLLDDCANRVKAAIGAKSGKVVFGGTSSQLIENLMVAVNRIYDKDEYNVYCSCYEHDSFFRYGDNKLLDLSELDTVFDISNERRQSLVIWQGVNNITGEIFPTKQMGELVHKYNGFYICDGTTQIGHTPIKPNIADWCDFYVFSGHKLGTELGIGCCWVSDRLDKWLNGFKLHGTPNLAGALAMAQATKDACDISSLEERQARWVDLSDEIYSRLLDVCDEAKQIGNNEGCWAINAIYLPGFNADALQQYLASKQIYVSIGGSACAEKHDYRVLNAYGLSNDEASEVIRVSFGTETTEHDINEFVSAVIEYKEKFVR